MFVLLLAALLGTGCWLIADGIRAGRASRIRLGALLGGAGILFFALLSFWSEMLWFGALGYSPRFWTVVGARLGSVLLGGLIGGSGVALVAWSYGRRRRTPRAWPELAGTAGGVLFGLCSWEEILLFLNRVPSGVLDPILRRDTGFYLFQLPLYDRLFWLLLWIAGLGLLTTLVSSLSLQSGPRLKLRESCAGEAVPLFPVLRAAAVLALVLAYGSLLMSYHLLYSDLGVVSGPGWTDVHVRLPAYRIMAVLILVLGAGPLLPAVRRLPRRWLRGPFALEVLDLHALGVVWLGIVSLWFASLFVAPALVQWLVVEPNEITFEKPYIAHNIDFTRHAFRLHEVEERQFPTADRLTPELVRESQHLLSEARLWDLRALDAVYEQFQEIRLYYEFFDEDMDRYQIGDRYRQVIISARELAQSNLPSESQTFVNRHFKYTHGYGLTLSTVSDFTPDGLPNLLVKDIPPESEVPELQVERPQIYYGELTRAPVVVNTREAEFDYPRGDENVYIRYSGTGGVQLKNAWRRFVFAWKFGGTQLLFSSYPTRDTRILFHRQVRERVAMLAPFLEVDRDPYLVVVDGRLYWIIDAYTVSRYFPYSEPFSSREVIEYKESGRTRRLVNTVAGQLDGVNYVRNSVKAVVDAFEGSVELFVFDPEDPLIRGWWRAFPTLFRDRDEMPEGLRAHVRYPASLLQAQGLVYSKYHMRDPEVFYNLEDLWVRATEKYHAKVQPVEPYYAMWELPGSDRAEFVLILPFTPKHRQVLIGWIAGLCDGENYGRFVAYKFSKEKRMLGPQQVETKIDQDRFLAAQLTLWDQRGSSVIRGNVLALPIEDTLLYVEPIYLQADTAAYPELRLVAVMHGDDLSYAETFEEALQGLFEAEGERASGGPAARGDELRELAGRANDAFERYLQLQGEQRFEEAARELQSLRDLLARLASGQENAAAAEPGGIPDQDPSSGSPTR
jgi:uncharacterized membrane protein (UPF0182 family)